MKPQRYEAIDSLRGLAMVWMTAFHFAFDLNYFGLIQQNFYRDPLWTWQRTLIVSLFLFCAGLGQAVAVAQGQRWPRFWRRWAQVAGCALLVSLGSWLMFPKTFIYFGVLHGMALMLILIRVAAGWGRVLWLLGAAAIASKFIAASLLQHDASLAALFNTPWLNWLGWITRKPFTEDYVPLFPWLGVVCWGAATGAWLLQPAQQALLVRLPSARPLAWLGRYSLPYYMLHQPVLIALVGLWVRLG